MSRGGSFMKVWRRESIWCVQDGLNGAPCVSRIGVCGNCNR